MSPKMALVIYDKCRPEKCVVCAAAKACERLLIEQEAPNKIPMTNPVLCRGCGDCVRACPNEAIRIFD